MIHSFHISLKHVQNFFITLPTHHRSTLYKGLEPILYSLFASNFVYFYSFHGLRRIAGDKTAIKDLAIGAVAGTINVLTTTPLWVVNTRIRMQDSIKQKQSSKDNTELINEKTSAIHVNSIGEIERLTCLSDGLFKIVQKQGPSALWSGTMPSLVLVSNPAIQFMIFETLKRNLQKILETKELSSYHIFALGAVSKSVSTVLSYPLQVVQTKRRYGSQDVKDKSMIKILTELAKKGTLYKGMEAKLMQTVMTTSLMFVFYDKIYNFVTKVSKTI